MTRSCGSTLSGSTRCGFSSGVDVQDSWEQICSPSFWRRWSGNSEAWRCCRWAQAYYYSSRSSETRIGCPQASWSSSDHPCLSFSSISPKCTWPILDSRQSCLHQCTHLCSCPTPPFLGSVWVFSEQFGIESFGFRPLFWRRHSVGWRVRDLLAQDHCEDAWILFLRHCLGRVAPGPNNSNCYYFRQQAHPTLQSSQWTAS